MKNSNHFLAKRIYQLIHTVHEQTANVNALSQYPNLDYRFISEYKFTDYREVDRFANLLNSEKKSDFNPALIRTPTHAMLFFQDTASNKFYFFDPNHGTYCSSDGRALAKLVFDFANCYCSDTNPTTIMLDESIDHHPNFGQFSIDENLYLDLGICASFSLDLAEQLLTGAKESKNVPDMLTAEFLGYSEFKPINIYLRKMEEHLDRSQFSTSQGYAHQVLQIDPNNPEALIAWYTANGNLQFLCGRYELACQNFNTAKSLIQKLSPEKQKTAEARLELGLKLSEGYALLLGSDFQNAKTFFTDALKSHPDKKGLIIGKHIADIMFKSTESSNKDQVPSEEDLEKSIHHISTFESLSQFTKEDYSSLLSQVAKEALKHYPSNPYFKLIEIITEMNSFVKEIDTNPSLSKLSEIRAIIEEVTKGNYSISRNLQNRIGSLSEHINIITRCLSEQTKRTPEEFLELIDQFALLPGYPNLITELRLRWVQGLGDDANEHPSIARVLQLISETIHSFDLKPQMKQKALEHLKKHPKPIDIYRRKMEDCLDRSQFLQCIDYAKDALRIAANDPEALFAWYIAQANLQFQAGQFHNSTDILNTIADGNLAPILPSERFQTAQTQFNTVSNLSFGYKYLEEGNLVQAKKIFQLGLKLPIESLPNRNGFIIGNFICDILSKDPNSLNRDNIPSEKDFMGSIDYLSNIGYLNKPQSFFSHIVKIASNLYPENHYFQLMRIIPTINDLLNQIDAKPYLLNNLLETFSKLEPILPKVLSSTKYPKSDTLSKQLESVSNFVDAITEKSGERKADQIMKRLGLIPGFPGLKGYLCLLWIQKREKLVATDNTISDVFRLMEEALNHPNLDHTAKSGIHQCLINHRRVNLPPKHSPWSLIFVPLSLRETSS